MMKRGSLAAPVAASCVTLYPKPAQIVATGVTSESGMTTLTSHAGPVRWIQSAVIRTAPATPDIEIETSRYPSGLSSATFWSWIDTGWSQ